MIGALIILAVTVITGIILYTFHRATTKAGEEDIVVEPKRPEGCCGQHEVCEKDSMLAAVSKEIEYYDDEELDAYCRRPSNAYTPEEADAFREVLYTMREAEVAGWVRSLTLRGIELPDEVKDEVLLIVGERRGQ